MTADVRNWEVGLLVTAWTDIDRALEGVALDDLTRQLDGGSSFAWTLAHVTHGIDSWINGRFQRLQPHPIYAGGRFRFGTDGAASDWQAIRQATEEVRERALTYLSSDAANLDAVMPYDGAYPPFREHGIQLRPAIIQNAIHHVYHLGEIATKRELMGYETPTFPTTYLGLLSRQES